MAFRGGLSWVKEKFSRGGSPPKANVGILPQNLGSLSNSAYLRCQQTLDDALYQLLEEPEAEEPFLQILDKIENCTGAEASLLLMGGSNSEGHPEVLAATEPKEPWKNRVLRGQLPADGPAIFGGIIRTELPQDGDKVLLQVQISDPSENTSYLLLRFPSSTSFSTAELHLLKSLAGRLGPVMSGTRRAKLKRRLALYEERAAIARELHDSLAQSLSYLMIQTSRLQSKLEKSKEGEVLNQAPLESVLHDLRSNLNVSYRQLREIINTFRLTLDAPNLEQEISNTLEEYEKLSGIAFSLDFRLPANQLTANEEVQSFLIVREALSNLVRHSHARQGWITVDQGDDQHIYMAVEDDGVGFADDSSWGDSHGLNTMKERAQALEGDLNVEPRPEGGIRVLLEFVPARLSGFTATGETPPPSPEREEQA